MEQNPIIRLISQIAFIFLIFVVISSGYITQILSCQMKHLLKNNLYVRHIIGIIMIFVFIMLEGGWDFDKKRQDKIANDWSSGNTVNTFIYALGIYVLFLLSSKSQLIPNLLFFLFIFIIYMSNTYRSYLYKRKEISEDTNKKILYAEYTLLGVSGIIFLYGLYDYIAYQKKMRENDFDWFKFFLGVTECDGL